MNKNKDMDIVQELLAETFIYNVPVYTVGAGNNVQEDILKNMSSLPQEVNNGFVLMDYFNSKSKTFCSMHVSLYCDCRCRMSLNSFI